MKFTIDCSAKASSKLGNRFSNLSFWHYMGTTPDERVWHEWAEAMPEGWLKDQYPWLEEMQIFTASGGACVGHPREPDDAAPCEFDRDLFRDPADRSVLDDYDFSPLVRACSNMLRQGVRPCLKLHGVPLKFSAKPKIDWFRVNCRPPDDFGVYADYLSALVQAMVEAFGIDEVRTWRWFIGTEMENLNWWEAEDGSPEATMLAYCRLHDWSVLAIERVLGADETRGIGAHAMANGGGLWDPGDFIAHCRSGRNHATDEIGSRLDFFAISYYDRAPGAIESDEWDTSLTGEGADLAGFDAAIGRTRNLLDEHDFADVPIEVSEGAIMFGMDGKWLWHGLCPGGAYDASWCAWAYWKMLETETVLWSRWSLLRTGGLFAGPQAAATHALRMMGAMARDHRLPVTLTSGSAPFIRVVAGRCPEQDRVRLLAFHHAPDVTRPTEMAEVAIHLDALPFEGPFRVTRRVVDANHGDFWPRWEADRARAGLTDQDFFRSRDQLDVAHALRNPAHVALWNHLATDYESLSDYPEAEESHHAAERGMLDLRINLPCFSVSQIEIEPMTERP